MNDAGSSAAASAKGCAFRLYTLGALHLVGSDGELLPGRGAELVLLAYLLRQGGNAARREELAALVWGRQDPAGARQALHQALALLQRTLGDALDVGADEVRVAPGSVALDASLFDREIAAGALAAAAERWAGDFLAGAESIGRGSGEELRAWLEDERRGLRQRLLWALEQLMAEQARRAAWGEAIRWGSRWTELEPWDERAHGHLVATLRQAGRVDDALAEHAAFRVRVRQDLGREPSPEYLRIAAEIALGADHAVTGEFPRSRNPAERRTAPVFAAGGIRADLRQQLYHALGGQYTLEQELTSGTMSRVFVAEETQFRRRVVIKVLNPELAIGLSVERFEREIMLAAALQDAHIVPVLGGGHVNGLPYYTMPYVEGQSLRRRLQAGYLPRSAAVAILRDVALALEYAHAQGVVHRDIKPDNVLLSSGGRTAVVTDFGVAKAMTESKRTPRTDAITLEGFSVGTPEYMAPEQARGGVVDARADLYSWGVMAYELLTGGYPFPDAKSPVDFLAAQVSTPPAPLVSAQAKIPPVLAKLVMRCLEKSPARRPQSAGELLAQLDLVQGRVSQGVRRLSQRWRPGVAALVLLAGAGLAAAWYGTHYRGTLSATGQATGGGGSTAGDHVKRAAISTVAVLPFVNTSGDPKDEYFSDGMTDELAHALARLPALRVAGRTSSYAFKAKPVPAREIGRRLGVAGVVAGTVRRSGDRLRVTVELTSTADGLVLWSDSYESRATDVFEVQDEFTGAIVAAIAPSLRGATSTSLAGTSRGTRDAEAYDMYLRGQFFWARRGTENLARAADFFQRAIARDSSFARAYAGLALVRSVASYYGGVSGDSAYALTLPAAARALALDSASADAHLALGTALFHRGHFEEAKAQYRAGLARDPNNASGHMWLGDALFATGYIKDALGEQATASAIDALSAPVASARAEALYVARHFKEAMAAASRMRDLDSSYTHALNIYARAFTFGGVPDSAIRHLEANLRGPTPNRTLHAWLAVAYAGAGRRADAEREAAPLRRGNRSAVEQARSAIADLALGNAAPFFGMLDGGPRESALVNLGYFGCDPLYDGVRDDPRYLAAARRHGVYVCALRTPSPFRRGGH